jgi:hypothetical protein
MAMHDGVDVINDDGLSSGTSPPAESATNMIEFGGDILIDLIVIDVVLSREIPHNLDSDCRPHTADRDVAPVQTDSTHLAIDGPARNSRR